MILFLVGMYLGLFFGRGWIFLDNVKRDFSFLLPPKT